jgi:hypothetical protein
MKIIFSRKGFDSTSGGAPSPILDGVPYGLPIPTGKYPSETTYRDLGLGHILPKVKSECAADDFCHEDPMFWDDRCAFGQTSASQSHLSKNGVGVGDVFLFFGLFAEGDRDRHHRIFGYLKVDEVRPIGSQPRGDEVEGARCKHPHTIAKWNVDGKKWDSKNTLYLGPGRKAKRADPTLRLTKLGGPTSHWVVPRWLRETELTLSPARQTLAKRRHTSRGRSRTRVCC